MGWEEFIAILTCFMFGGVVGFMVGHGVAEKNAKKKNNNGRG